MQVDALLVMKVFFMKECARLAKLFMAMDAQVVTMQHAPLALTMHVARMERKSLVVPCVEHA